LKTSYSFERVVAVHC